MTALVGNHVHLLVMGNRGDMTPACSSHTLLHSIYYVGRLQPFIASVIYMVCRMFPVRRPQEGQVVMTLGPEFGG